MIKTTNLLSVSVFHSFVELASKCIFAFYPQLSARTSLCEMRNKGSEFEQNLQACSDIIDAQLKQLSNIQAHLMQYGFVPQKGIHSVSLSPFLEHVTHVFFFCSFFPTRKFFCSEKCTSFLSPSASPLPPFPPFIPATAQLLLIINTDCQFCFRPLLVLN